MSMNMSFYTAAVGAQQQQLRMNVLGNNIANVNTHGYRAEKPSFATLMFGDLTGIDNENLPRGTGARMIQANTDYSLSAMADTGRPLDYAIVGDGFFALLDIGTGEISYTRDGSFTMSSFLQPNEEGVETEIWLLSDGRGRAVLDRTFTSIEVVDPSLKLDPGIFNFINKDGMRPIGDNRYVPVEKNGEPILQEDAATLQGMLETSNVDLANEMTKVIEAQRSFSYALRMVQTSDEVTSTINGLRG